MMSLSCASLATLGMILAACGGTPAPAAAPVPAVAAAAPAPSSTASFLVPSKRLGEDRRINVYLPPGYTGGAATFPVLYMPDGGVEEDFPHVTATVERLIAEGAIRPLVVVGIENTERRRDLTGPTEVASDREIAPRVGGSEAFRGFLRDELLPLIEARYRVTGERGIIGESLAGLFVVEVFARDPDLFRHAIALSPSLWWNGEHLAGELVGLLTAAGGPPRTLFLSSADEDNIVPVVDRVGAALRAAPPAGLTLFVEPRPDLRHDNIYRGMEARALTAVFAPPAP
jgi:predicted alpha/beta superfamily hydrolase